MKPRTAFPRHWLRWLVSALALLALGWMLRQVDWPQAQQTWQRVPAAVWCVSALGLVASHWLRAGRVRAEWRAQLQMGWREAWGLMVRHSAWVVLVPMRGGEAVYVWALHRQGGVPLRQAGLSLLRLRLQDMAVLAVLGVTLLAPWPEHWRLGVGLCLLGLAMLVLPRVWWWLQQRWSRRHGPSEARLPAPAWASWGYALSNWVVKLGAVAWPLCHVLPVSWAQAWGGAAGGELAAALPVQPPAGFGPYEAGVVAGLQNHTHLALPWVDMALAALVVHLLALVVTVGSATLAHLLGWSQRDLRRSSA